MIEVRNLKIEDVCTFIGGSQPPKSVFSGFPIEGYVRLVQIRDFKNENFPTYIPLDSTSKFFEKKDVMIGRYGPPIFQILRGLEGAYNVALLKARPKKNIINDYLYYFLKQLDLFEYIDKLSPRTGGQTGVDLFSLNQYPIRLPDLLTQQKIASVLSALDDKIELNNRINSELEAMAKLLYKYWFVQFDFPYDLRQSKPADETSKPQDIKPYKSSGGKMVWNKDLNREIPEGWEVKKLHQVAKIVMGQSPLGESYNENGEGMIFFQGSTDFGWRFPKNRVYTTSPTRFSSQGDILLSVRAPIGTMNLALRDCCIGRGLAALNSKEGYNSFLIYQMTNFKKKFDYLNSVGTTFGSLTKDDLYNLELSYPESSLLRNFENTVSAFDRKIEINALENQELSSLRDWLLPMLMNGQVTVADAEEIVNEELGMVAEGERGRYEKK
jgi:type I restriction enzyme S subunit